MHAEIATRRKEIAELCRSHGVARPELFGSDARRTDFDLARSAADFLAEFDPSRAAVIADRNFGLQDDLAAALDREDDLVSELPGSKCLLAGINECREVVHEA